MLALTEILLWGGMSTECISLPLYQVELTHSKCLAALLPPIAKTVQFHTSATSWASPCFITVITLPSALYLWLCFCYNTYPSCGFLLRSNMTAHLVPEICTGLLPGFWSVWGLLEWRRQMGWLGEDQFLSCYSNLFLVVLQLSIPNIRLMFTPAAASDFTE